MKNTQRIVCAANKFTDGSIIIGLRHFDAYMQMQRHLVLSDAHIEKQGFLDGDGCFHNRQDAWKIAEAAGQIMNRVPGDDKDGGTLFSENLY